MVCRWVWKIDCPVWHEALDHHYHHNPHHPQQCPGQEMEECHLEESVVDMMACNWERRLSGAETASNRDISFCQEVRILLKIILMRFMFRSTLRDMFQKTGRK